MHLPISKKKKNDRVKTQKINKQKIRTLELWKRIFIVLAESFLKWFLQRTHQKEKMLVPGLVGQFIPRHGILKGDLTLEIWWRVVPHTVGEKGVLLKLGSGLRVFLWSGKGLVIKSKAGSIETAGALAPKLYSFLPHIWPLGFWRSCRLMGFSEADEWLKTQCFRNQLCWEPVTFSSRTELPIPMRLLPFSVHPLLASNMV